MVEGHKFYSNDYEESQPEPLRAYQPRSKQTENAIHRSDAKRRDPDPRRDAVLLSRLATRDASALGDIFDRWGDCVHALVIRIVDDERLAGEIVEAVFAQAWRESGDFAKDRRSACARLLAMARTRAHDALRSAGSAHRDVTAAGSQLDDDCACDDPLANIDLTEKVGSVAAALEALSRDQRVALELRYFDDFAPSVISARLAVPVSDVVSLLRTALSTLHQQLPAVLSTRGHASTRGAEC